MFEHHPDRVALDRFVRAEVLADEVRWIVDHIRSGCEICQPHVDRLLPNVDQVLHGHPQPLPAAAGSVTPSLAAAASTGGPLGQRPTLLPPLSMPLSMAPPLPQVPNTHGPAADDAAPCGGWACSGDDEAGDPFAALLCGCDVSEDSLPLMPVPPFSSPANEAENEVWDRIVAKVAQGIEPRIDLVSSERKAAPRLVAELLEHAPAERLQQVLDNRRFQTLEVCELLVETSFDAGGRDVAAAIALAELAIRVADQLDCSYYGAALVHDSRARAWAYLGNARRLGADLAGAEQALAYSESLAEEGSADPLEEARLLELRAALLSDQGWFEEAAASFDAVIEIYEEVKDPHRKGLAQIAKGVSLGFSGRSQTATELIQQGLQLVDAELEPRLALGARQSLAWFLNDCGHWDLAQHQLDSFRASLGEAADPWTELRLEWLDARIAHRSGRHTDAEQQLCLLRQRCIDRGLGYEASMVMLDLAALYLDQGRGVEVRQLTDEMLPIFLSQLPRHAAAALVELQQAAAGNHVTPKLVRDVAAYLQRARRNPAFAFQHAA